MPDVDVPDYIPGARWKAQIVRNPDQGPTAVHLWAVDAMGAPHHAQVMECLGRSPEQVCAFAWSLDSDGVRAEMTVVEPFERSAAESLLRERIPDIEFGLGDEWNFG